MEKVTLKLFEFYNLDAELNGLRNQATGEVLAKGLLHEKLPLTTKYWLTDLSKKVTAEKALVEELKNDLIKKYGKEDDKGSFSIPMSIDEVDENGDPVKDLNEKDEWVVKKKLNPAFEVFNNEFEVLLQTEKEIEYKALKLSDFEKVETSENYATLFKLIKVEEEPTK